MTRREITFFVRIQQSPLKTISYCIIVFLIANFPQIDDRHYFELAFKTAPILPVPKDFIQMHLVEDDGAPLIHFVAVRLEEKSRKIFLGTSLARSAGYPNLKQHWREWREKRLGVLLKGKTVMERAKMVQVRMRKLEEEYKKKLRHGTLSKADQIVEARRQVRDRMKTDDCRLECNWGNQFGEAYKAAYLWELKPGCWQCQSSMKWDEAQELTKEEDYRNLKGWNWVRRGRNAYSCAECIVFAQFLMLFGQPQ